MPEIHEVPFHLLRSIDTASDNVNVALKSKLNELENIINDLKGKSNTDLEKNLEEEKATILKKLEILINQNIQQVTKP